MKLLLAIVLIIIITVLGTRLSFTNRRLPMGFRNILFTGTEYILIGFLLGDSLLKVLDEPTRLSLTPFLFFALSWVGFIFGLQFEVRTINKVPRDHFLAAGFQSVFTGTVVVFVMLGVLPWTQPADQGKILIAALALGGAAAPSAQSALAIVSREYRLGNQHLLDLLRFVSSIDGVFALLFFWASLSLLVTQFQFSLALFSALQWLVVAVIVGALPALILFMFTRRRFSQQELVLFIFGAVMFCGGLAIYLNQSPLLSSFIFGVIIANNSRHHTRILSTLLPAEKSIYIVLLLFLGSGWRIPTPSLVLIGGLYIITRAVGKLAGMWLATRCWKSLRRTPARLGIGLFSDGGFAVAMVLNLVYVYPDLRAILFTVIIFSVGINELFSPKLLIGLFDVPKDARHRG